MRVSACVWCERARGEKQLLLCLARFLVFYAPNSFRGTSGLRFSLGFGLLAVRCSSRSSLVSGWTGSGRRRARETKRSTSRSWLMTNYVTRYFLRTILVPIVVVVVMMMMARG